MTTLISWISYDQNKQASLYVASDSRLSWGNKANWDSGRKIYCSSKHPEIIGYCGDVVFCSQIISQIITYIDSCDVFEKQSYSESRFSLINNLVQRSFGDYPKQFSLDNFEIIYATREEKYNFHAYLISWNKKYGWGWEKLNIPDKTGLIIASGSGGSLFRKKYAADFLRSDIGGFSRSFYTCLCGHIHSQADLLTGGTPQMAGLFNKDPAKHHGILINNRRYIYGMEVDENQNINNVRWVNEKFENCDGNAQIRLSSAQPQPFPKNIGKPLGKDTRRIPLPR